MFIPNAKYWCYLMSFKTFFMALSLAVLEGVAIGFNPDYKVLGSTYPWIARKVLTDNSPQLKSSLQALLYEVKLQFLLFLLYQVEFLFCFTFARITVYILHHTTVLIPRSCLFRKVYSELIV